VRIDVAADLPGVAGGLNEFAGSLPVSRGS
jgi:hypothetical protein